MKRVLSWFAAIGIYIAFTFSQFLVTLLCAAVESWFLSLSSSFFLRVLYLFWRTFYYVAPLYPLFLFLRLIWGTTKIAPSKGYRFWLIGGYCVINWGITVITDFGNATSLMLEQILFGIVLLIFGKCARDEYKKRREEE